jgi:hypothetical protein
VVGYAGREMSEHNFQDELEERDDVVDQQDEPNEPDDREPWAKTSSGDAEEISD